MFSEFYILKKELSVMDSSFFWFIKNILLNCSLSKLCLMKEELIEYVWKYKVYTTKTLYLVNSQVLEIISTGVLNTDSGPDFFNAKIKIGNQVWAGNIELHVNSSDWNKHGHNNDEAYDNVILHVVYNNDVDISVNGRLLPVLEVKNYMPNGLEERYCDIVNNKEGFLKCGNFKPENIRQFEYENWIDRLFIDRLEDKIGIINNQIKISSSHWEQVLFRTLARAFGLKLNGDAFNHFANSFDYIILLKSRYDITILESVFFGQGGFLDIDVYDDYFEELKREYFFIKRKHKLESIKNSEFKYFRTRPANFPTVRMAQLAQLYFSVNGLFYKVTEASNVKELRGIFKVGVSEYWQNHYMFGKANKSNKKVLTDSFIDLLIVNSIIPLRYSYFRSIGDFNKAEETVNLATEIKGEVNKITKEFKQKGWKIDNAKYSQAFIQLNKSLCVNNKCLSCFIGNNVLSSIKNIEVLT